LRQEELNQILQREVTHEIRNFLRRLCFAKTFGRRVIVKMTRYMDRRVDGAKGCLDIARQSKQRLCAQNMSEASNGRPLELNFELPIFSPDPLRDVYNFDKSGRSC